jgi:hypothetical protein
MKLFGPIVVQGQLTVQGAAVVAPVVVIPAAAAKVLFHITAAEVDTQLMQPIVLTHYWYFNTP